MARFIIRLYRRADADPRPGQYVAQVEVEADSVYEAGWMNLSEKLPDPLPEGVTFGMLFNELDEPYLPLDLRLQNLKRNA